MFFDQGTPPTYSKIRYLIIISTALLTMAVFSGCEKKKEKAEEKPLRAIKSMALKERAADQRRVISGIVEAGTVTDLSFEISGQITKLNANIGDRVTKGDIIAVLDAEPYRLKLETARGELGSARAALKDAREKFKQQKTLLAKGFTTKTNFDTATANLKTAESKVQISLSKLSIAERDLRKTRLIAPFTGRISKKHVNVFTDITTAQKIYEIHTEGNLEIEVSVPENLVRHFKVKDRVTIKFPTLPNLSSSGHITEIGSRTETANAFPVKIELEKQFPELRPGITAEVTFRYSTDATGTAFIIPATALLPKSESRSASIFVFDRSKNAVYQRKVKVINIRDNDLEVTGTLKAGDIIAIAGISFLSDGMKVRLLEEEK